MTTQEAEALIKKGWILKHHKDPFFHHEVWLKDPTHNGPGCAKYISHGVFGNLLKLGYKAILHK
jgi:hypothetical protein